QSSSCKVPYMSNHSDRDDHVTDLGLFFFSGRRRHTRFSRDWSSDVCSSDLLLALGEVAARPRLRYWLVAGAFAGFAIATKPLPEIGRASCRERVQVQAFVVSSEEYPYITERSYPKDRHTHITRESIR